MRIDHRPYRVRGRSGPASARPQPASLNRSALQWASLALASLFISACATPPDTVDTVTRPEATPAPASAPNGLPVPKGHIKTGEARSPYTLPARPEAASLFSAVPGWQGIDPRPGLSALQASCAKLLARTDLDARLSDAAGWAGTVAEWRPACSGLAATADADEARALLERAFVPVEVVDPAGAARFTGYFEPVIASRRRPEGAFTAPIPGPPGDLIVDGDRRLQRLASGRTRPYPPRSEITPAVSSRLGYAHPADLFFLQIQGSGRLVFKDGSIIRAAYHAHNGHPFRSTANWLIARGEITRGEASMQGIRAWMDRATPERVRAAINANPRYVFFEAQVIGDPARGPAGSQGVPLTPLGSMAVDRAFHALGVPYVVETTAPGLGGSWRGVLVAQDTGGAIRGPVRGDIFFGTGEDAGRRAGTMNAPGRMWALLPPVIAERLRPGTTNERPPVSP